MKEYGVLTPRGAKYLLSGSTGALFIYPDRPGKIYKLPFQEPGKLERFEVEKQIYRRLGRHRGIIGCLSIEDDSICLEFAEHGCIRQFYEDGNKASLAERIQWSLDLALAVQYVHQKNVRHADLGGRNVLLDAKRNVRLCDFAGSGIDGSRVMVYAQGEFRHPDDDADPTVNDIHALGSTIFEIITYECPHAQEEANLEGMAAFLIREGKYPDVNNVELGAVIKKC